MSNRLPIYLILISSILLFGCSDESSTGNSPNQASTASPKAPDKEAPQSDFKGNLDTVNCESIVGWVWDRRQPNSPLKIEIFDGETKIDTVTAAEIRQDLVRAGIGNGAHGFTYPIPARLKDGKPHSIWAKVSDNDFNLYKLEPKKLTCPAG